MRLDLGKVVICLSIFFGGCSGVEFEGPNELDTSMGYCSFLGDITDEFYNTQQYEGCHGYDPARAITCCSIHGGTWIETGE